MSTAPTLQIESTKPEDTFVAGEKLGQILKGGEVILMIGDLGAGKTHFVRGIASGLESEDEVASPSFTISREYHCRDEVVLHHFDFYRLEEPGIMQSELEELVGDKKSVVVIEWGAIVESVVPDDHITVELHAIADEEHSRSIQITMPLEASS